MSLITYLNPDAIKDASIEGIKLKDGSVSASKIDSSVASTEYVDNAIANIDVAQSISITWRDLKAKRDAGQLTPGMQYRITDYQCTTTQSNTKSAGHQFDIIVVADDERTLNETARVIKHPVAEGETDYFADNDLNAWQIWYCLDNDTTRFAWADSTNGKGVIYRMIDEFNNDVPYDFKNIIYVVTEYFVYRRGNTDYTFTRESSIDMSLNETQYYGYTTKAYPGPWGYGEDNRCWIKEATPSTDSVMYNSGGGIIEGGAIVEVSSDHYETYTFGKSADLTIKDAKCYNNIMLPYTYGAYKATLNKNTFANNCYNNTFDFNCHDNTFGDKCHDNTFGSNCYNNIFNFDSTYGYDGCYNNSFGSNCHDNTFEYDCHGNTFDSGCYNNTFKYTCRNNTFGPDCYNNTFRSHCDYNSLGSGCHDNKLDGSRNTFGPDCYNNTCTGGYVEYNTFGPECHDNTFGPNCMYNSLGSFCYGNTFDSAERNSLGNSCYSNTIRFGGSNTLGNSCYSNTLGSNCRSNSLGNSCYSNTFGDGCSHNTFGDGCSYNAFATDASGTTPASYFQHNKFESGVSYCILVNAETASSSNQAQNYHLKSSVVGTLSNKRVIETTRNLTYDVTVALNSEGTIKTYCEADLIR